MLVFVSGFSLGAASGLSLPIVNDPDGTSSIWIPRLFVKFGFASFSFARVSGETAKVEIGPVAEAD